MYYELIEVCPVVIETDVRGQHAHWANRGEDEAIRDVLALERENQMFGYF